MGLRVLDLFCGAGGAAAGYARAGFQVFGVDIKYQRYYPYPFTQWGALEFLESQFFRTMHFDLIHASPPCQRYSSMITRWDSTKHPDLIAPTRELLQSIGIPYVIENVPGAPLIDPIMLCGGMFNLHSGDFVLRRHRLFETSFPIEQPVHPKHYGRALGVYGNTGGTSKRDGLTFAKLEDWKIGMEIDWMNTSELRESIPPAYTEYIARSLIEFSGGKIALSR